MKKLFIAALAITAVVACSKDDAPVLDSAHKSISIQIANLTNETRGVTAPSKDANYQCAGVEDLKVIFCDAAGNKVGNAIALNAGDTSAAAGTFTFHGLSENVTKFFVIGTDNGPLATDPASLAAAKTLWESDQTDAEVGEIIVFGESGTFEYKGECTSPDNHDVSYPLFSASATVKPNVARVEISSISCTDLGTREADGIPTTLGFDKLTIKKLALGSMEEVLNNVLNATNPVSKVTTTADDQGNVWSWNFAGGAVANYPLGVTMDVAATSYVIASPERTITTTTYKNNADNSDLTSFEKGNIYKMAIEFSEEDLIDENNICINVTVTIADWVVNYITPEFGN